MSNKILILSGVSGVGKTTLAKILKNDYDFQSSISYTSRSKRHNETNAQHYHFITKFQFKKLIKKECFIEYDKVFGKYYGTSYEDVITLLNKGNVILTLSSKGYEKLKKIFKNKLIGIYLLPPSLDKLQERVLNRNCSELEISKRFKNIDFEIKQNSKFFEYILEPNDVNSTLREILKIFKNHN